MRRTKIVATLGPATDPPEVLAAVIAAGVDVVRLNAAHSTEDELAARLAAVRAASADAGRHVGVLLDLPGPKVRVGVVSPGTVLEAGARLVLSGDETPGDAARVSVTHCGLADDVASGMRILIDDGRIELVVEAVDGHDVLTRVVTGGPLASRKGVNVPGVTLSVDAVTERDAALAAWAGRNEIDWVGQSFVRCAADVAALRSRFAPAPHPGIVAKIEKHEATACIDEIVAAADGVMVARGDLGVETSPEQVPVLQRRIVRTARAAGKPVIIATEMLDSMRERPRPTRAEASDVANAIFERADAVMLSGETAAGSYPVIAVETMARIVGAAEESLTPSRPPRATTRDSVQAAVSAAVSELAAELELAAIVTLTQSGATALAVSRYRPATPLVAVAPSARVARRLALVWGVRSVVMAFEPDSLDLLENAAGAVCEAGFAARGEKIAITAGLASSTPGGTDFVHVRTA